MSDILRNKLIAWLRNKTTTDLLYVKKYYQLAIFYKHAELTEYDIELLVLEPQRIHHVEQTVSHSDRLLAVRVLSKKLDLYYVILDPFNPMLHKVYVDKVAVVTAYPKSRQLT
jgi:hypothetical protein